MIIWMGSLTLLCSALLLFWIEPLAAKAILPNYGGVPMVWNTAMVFFQSILLFAYLYVYFLGRSFTFKTQMKIHFAVAMVAFAFLPILWQHVPEPPLIAWPSIGLLMSLSFKIGWPVFLCATTAPLVQHWLSTTAHPHARDPYFLYSASNLGSLLALVAFPFFLEPRFGIQNQSWIWSGFFILYASILTLTIIRLSTDQIKIDTPIQKSTLTTKTILLWVGLSMAPSSLFLGVTQHLTIDLASVPFLWITPLFVYLSTFVITFSKRPIISQSFMLQQFPFLLIFPSLLLSSPYTHVHLLESLLFHLVGLFACAMVCNGRLMSLRPSTDRLTEFYCWIAFGGLLGGIFNTFLAPILFSGIYEYPIAIIACILLAPSKTSIRDWNIQDTVFVLMIGTILYLINFALPPAPLTAMTSTFTLALVAVIATVFYNSSNKIRFSAALSLLFIFGFSELASDNKIVLKEIRNFYGVKRITLNKTAGYHSLTNGSTLHGMQFLDRPLSENNLTTYYRPSAEIAKSLEINNQQLTIGIIGLGVGTMICQFNDSHLFVFEIDPAVVAIAQNPQYFTYLRECKGANIILGDARLKLKQQPAQSFNALFFDAFSSDSIPIHLLTENAVQMYLEKLKPNGALIFHISQRYLDLKPVLLNTAKKFDLSIMMSSQHTRLVGEYTSSWIILTKDQTLLAHLKNEYHWRTLPPETKSLAWSDDYADLFSIVRW